MMTCTSDRSGMASSGVRATANRPKATSMAVISSTRKRLWIDQRMMALIMGCIPNIKNYSTRRRRETQRFFSLNIHEKNLCVSLRPQRLCVENSYNSFFDGLHALETGAHARLGVDQKLARGHDDIALLDTVANFDPVIRLDAGRHLHRLEAPGAQGEHHGIAAPGADQRLARDKERLRAGGYAQERELGGQAGPEDRPGTAATRASARPPARTKLASRSMRSTSTANPRASRNR